MFNGLAISYQLSAISFWLKLFIPDWCG